jgi:response regulator NasT
MVRTDKHLNPVKLRVLIVDETGERAELVEQALRANGYDIAGVVLEPHELLEQVSALRPDVIVIDLDSPSRDTLEHVCIVSRDQPRPVVMFAQDDDNGMIRQAVCAGVSAYVVGGLSADRIRPILEVAVARFEQFQLLRDELQRAKTDLAQRKTIERAKGLLMRQRAIDEEQAYAEMRKLAMNQNKRVIDVAQNVLEVAELLGNGAA